MRRLLTLVVVAVLASPFAARADGSIQLVAGGGVAKPLGDIGDGAKLGDVVDWAFPLDGQLQFRILKQLAVGGYVRYAPTALASGCSGCSVNDLAFGARLEARFSDKLEGGGWIGVFGGYERLKYDSTNGTRKSAVTYSGPEGGAAGGVDFELGGLTVGPYVQLTIGEFTGASGGRVIHSKGAHAFFGGGLRLALLL